MSVSTTNESPRTDRKSTRLNSSHLVISYAVFCLKKKVSNFLKNAFGAAFKALLDHRLLAYIRGASATSGAPNKKPPTASPHVWAFFFNDTAPTDIHTLSLHDALPI